MDPGKVLPNGRGMTTIGVRRGSGQRRRLAFRTGLVLAAVMGVFNTINGIGSLIDPRFGQVDPSMPAQPMWISLALAVFGVVTLAAVVPAWRGSRAAIWTVVVTRLTEAWSALVLPFLPGAPAGMWGFVLVLVVFGSFVAYLVALGLRPLR